MTGTKKSLTVATATFSVVLATLTFLKAQAFGQTPVTTIQQARQMLETYSDGKKLGNIDLTAVNDSWEVELGKGIRAIVVSTNYGGGIALFSPDGVMENSIAAGEAESVQVFNMSSDGVSQILTDEITDKGTGFLEKNFNLYSVSGDSIKKLWKGLSFKREALWRPDVENIKTHEVQNFIRFDEAGTGYEGRMTYLVSTGAPGRFRKIEYVMTGSVVHEVAGTTNRRRR